MPCEDMCDRGALYLHAKRIQFPVCHLIEMQAANICAHIASAQHFPDICQDIRHTCMRTAVKDNQPLAGFNDQALLVRKIIRNALVVADGVQRFGVGGQQKLQRQQRLCAAA